jgi:lipopolysaccharide/colanic/teichoic acid biosynthesis glycosyltransferase
MPLNRSLLSAFGDRRWFDKAVALIGLTLLSPVFVILAIAIKADSRGPVFFRQTRVGLSGRHFQIFKFRTMVHVQSNPRAITAADDNRITAVGRFLRKSKIDELPQLINVIRGEMALVGPRPEIPQYAEKYSEYDQRIVFAVPPGLTDFASIKFRDESELLARQSDPMAYYEQVIMPKKLHYYRFYAARSSLKLDIYIIALTVRSLLRDIFVRSRGDKNHLPPSKLPVMIDLQPPT